MTADLDLVDAAAWEAWRAAGLGASEVAGVLGISRWQSPWTVWARKTGLVEPSPATERQRIGSLLEAALAAMFSERTGLHVAGEQTWCSHPSDAWMRATVDGFVYESEQSSDQLGGVEFKTDGRFGWPDGIPADYQAQLQWSMAVTGLERWWLAVLFAGFRFDVYTLDADPADQSFMRERAGEFWHDHVLAGVMPDLDGSDATTDALRDLYPAGVVNEGAAVVLDRELVDEWRWCADETKAAKDAEATVKNRIVAELGDATEGMDDGGNLLVSWRPQTLRRLDTKRLEADFPDLVDDYRTETAFRVLRHHAPKGDL